MHLQCRWFARLDLTAAEGAKPGEEFLESERLWQVIVGAGVEAAHPIIDAVEGGKQKDGGVHAVAAEAPADLKTAHGGQEDIEHDDVVGAVRRKREPFFAVVGDVNGVAFFFEHAADDLSEAAFIFDDKDVHGFGYQLSVISLDGED